MSPDEQQQGRVRSCGVTFDQTQNVDTFLRVSRGGTQEIEDLGSQHMMSHILM